MSPQEASRLVGHSLDIVEWGRRWQKAWTSHNPKNENANCIGDSFGQLTDEIERLRTALRAVREILRQARYQTDLGWADQRVSDALEIISNALREGEGTP
jgi:hypothetical protein